jgi:hypothetical protein
MELWMCSHCEKRFYGSLEVVLILASAHRCRMQRDGGRETACLSCLSSPVGLCAYHASILMNRSRRDTTRLLYLE